MFFRKQTKDIIETDIASSFILYNKINPLSTQLDPKNCEMGRQLLDLSYDFKENTAIVQSTYCSRRMTWIA